MTIPFLMIYPKVLGKKLFHYTGEPGQDSSRKSFPIIDARLTACYIRTRSSSFSPDILPRKALLKKYR
jgi:hypothetical protein